MAVDPGTDLEAGGRVKQQLLNHALDLGLSFLSFVK